MRRLLILIVCAFFAIASDAQEPATGIPNFSSVQSIGIDSINRQNLNVNFSIPIAASPARGGNFSFPIVNDSLLWMKSSGRWTPVVDSAGSPTWGWKTKLPAGMTRFTNVTETCDSPPPIQSSPHYFNYSYVDPSGTTHKFSVNYYAFATICGFPTGPRTGYATDGSGYYLNATTGYAPIVTAANGKVITGTNWTDSNGNYFSATVVSSSETDWTDSAGHTPLKIITNSSSIQYKYPDTAGAYQTATLILTSTPIKTNFACSGVVEYTGTASLPTELDLANGQKYLFTYEATPGQAGYYTGRIKRVTLPTGGYIEHQYGATNDGINCVDATVKDLTVIISDGTTPSTWTFTRAASGSNWNTTVTAPQLSYDTAANQSVFTFNSSGQELIEKLYQGSTSGSLLTTVNRTWSFGGFPLTQITVLEDNSTQNEIETIYDSYGNLLTLKEHDWGTGTPGGIVRTTTYTYLNGSAYLAANIVNRPTRITVADNSGAIKARTDIAYDEAAYINSPCIPGAVQHNDATFTCTYATRGNPTTVTSYTDPVTPSGAIAKHSYYDSLGNLVKADLNCCQQKSWAYSSTTNYAFPDSITSGSTAPQLTVHATYNSFTGLVATVIDENSQQTLYSYADPGHLNRITAITRPDNKQITYSYDDVNLTAQTSSPVQGTNTVVQKTFLDALGRPYKQQLLDATSASYSMVETGYDAWSRAFKVSNPHNSTAQYWTETRTDALGRVVKSLLADGGQVTQVYSVNSVTLTDPTSVQRKSVTDGLGRLLSVYEPDVANGNALTQQTSYSYDVLNNLKQVTQGVQTRTFVYDALGRLTDSTTPEAGHFVFQYNNYNLLTQRTDARGVITTYTYDSLNRPYQTIYNVGSTGVPATATVTLTYGTSQASFNNGRVISMTDGSGSEGYSYDQFGRVTQLQKVVGTTYTTSYQYNLAGELTQITYPSGRIVVQTYDAIGRLCAIGASGSTCTTGTNYAAGYTYNPAGQVTGMNYGNGVVLTVGYNPDNLLLQSLQYKKGTTTLFNLNYWYKTDATNCPSAPAAANGEIRCIKDLVDNGRSVVYGYDALYRLTSAASAGSTGFPAWGLSETYDRYGNRTTQTVTAGTGVPASCLAVSATTNRVTGTCSSSTGFSNDVNGNMTGDGMNTIVYDAENRAVTSSSGSGAGAYIYDGNGLRVKKCVPNCTSPTSRTVYIFSGSKDVAEYDNGAAVTVPTKEFVYSGSQLLANFVSGTMNYFHHDHLSNRLWTDGSTGNISGQRGHFPFGETWYESGNATKFKFTTYERDNESGNDYAMARAFVSRFGRFSSPDPVAGDLVEPQSWNRYGYVRNNPLSLTDPLGLYAELVCYSYSVSAGHEDGNGNLVGAISSQTQTDCTVRDNGIIELGGTGLAGPDGIDLANELLKGIAGGNFKTKQKCKEFLAKLIKTNNLKISVDDLLAQIQSTAGAAQGNVFDGPSSNVPITKDTFPGYTDKTVGDYFRAAYSHEALSQFNGSAIYIVQANWEPSWILGASSYNGTYGSGTLMHEVLHKRSVGGGFSHTQMANALISIGLNPGRDRQLGHDVYGISDELARICF